MNYIPKALSEEQIVQFKAMNFRPCSFDGCPYWIGPLEDCDNLDEAQIRADGEIMQIQAVGFLGGRTIASGDAWCCMEHITPTSVRKLELSKSAKNKRKRERKKRG